MAALQELPEELSQENSSVKSCNMSTEIMELLELPDKTISELYNVNYESNESNEPILSHFYNVDEDIVLNSPLQQQPPVLLCPSDTQELETEASATPMEDIKLLDTAEEESATEASATPIVDIEPLAKKLRELLSKQTQDENLFKRLHNYATSKEKNKYLFLLSLLTASETLVQDQNVKAKALSLIISLSSSLIFLLNARNQSSELNDSIDKLRIKIADLTLGPPKGPEELNRTTSHGSAEYLQRLDLEQNVEKMFDRCSTVPTTNEANLAESREQAILLIQRGLNVTDKYLNTVIINVGNMHASDEAGSHEADPETTKNVKLLLQETIITYRKVLTDNVPATIICLCKLLGKLMSVSRYVSGSILNLIINIIKAIHNGLMVTGLYPYVIGASVVYYARYEIAQGALIVAKNGMFYILKSTIAEQIQIKLIEWLKEKIIEEATKAGTQAAQEAAQEAARQVVTQLFEEQAAEVARTQLTQAITEKIFTILANPANMNIIMDGARLALGQGGGGKKKRTKKRKRRRRGGSKKTKRRVKKSKKGGKRRRGGSKKRNRRSQRKTKK